MAAVSTWITVESHDSCQHADHMTAVSTWTTV